MVMLCLDVSNPWAEVAKKSLAQGYPGMSKPGRLAY
jgi:hypothetical protein